jgi:hypothetical protein
VNYVWSGKDVKGGDREVFKEMPQYSCGAVIERYNENRTQVVPNMKDF